MAANTSLSSFTKLNDLVAIYRPANARPGAPDPGTPQLIVICSWLGAASKHITKYTDAYQQRYPYATLLLIRSTLASMIQRADIAPANEVLASFVRDKSDSRSKPPIVLHAFSNGGARNVASLIVDFRTTRTGSTFPFDALILDSCPGRADVSSVSRAITLSLPLSSWSRSAASWLIYLAVLLLMTITHLFKIEDTVSQLRRRLNDPDVVPTSVRRLYLYSKADEMVRWEDVSGHVEEARERGYERVQEVVFEGAAHCALMLKGGERYWGAVGGCISGKL
ncbi:hypothetical protein BDY17DRAFT_311544 [Neohortaea acidophila]|uniref:Indole-diterpene biosynthesis protein-like protein PaxU n=1 Tax=Neohortaea acidophila TaxID=245834 RepID=A0A6A6PQG3_9PEZI|nr:uncharacterized protein BDY17DRAFT_311544 [Neohortaea acidophila]KAF2481921.1 hypothetical protein BDY17DRAFT_311544 [Neohortaea acidophila]